MQLFRVFSDIHWEHQTIFINKGIIDEYWTPTVLPTDNETILILAGDLWNGIKSIQKIREFSNRFKKVLITLGNHDFWGENINELAIDYELEIFRLGLTNVVLLDKSCYVDNDFIVIGASLWTDMDGHNPSIINMARYTMDADFRQIITHQTMDDYYRLRNIELTPSGWLRINTNEFGYIKQITELHRNKKVIIVTHHAPTTLSVHQRFKGLLANAFFVSDYSEFIMDNPQIKFWFHGHVHNHVDVNIHDTRIIANPRGYPNEGNTGFDEVSLYGV